MSEIQERVAHLSQGIGPRPAGTEEEQQAALYIADSFQQEAGFEASIEDFNCSPDYELPRVVYSVVAVLFAVLAIALPVMVIPSLIISLIAVGLFVAEALLGKPILGRLLNKGVSQNVVAKYQPPAGGEGQSIRRRKIILVSHYDSGKVQKQLSAPVFAALPVFRWVEFGAIVLIPVLLLIRLVSQASDSFLVVLNVVMIIAVVAALLPLISFILAKVAPYNEGANCNAAGVAVMMEVATRIGRGRAAEELEAGAAVLHGEDAAIASGYVPEGAQLVYDDPAIKEPEFAEESPEARLVAAKAAVAALSGKPVSSTINIDISDHLVQVKEPPVIAQTPDAMRERREEAMDAFAPVDVVDAGSQSAEGAAGAVGSADGAVAAAAAVSLGAGSGATMVAGAAQDVVSAGSGHSSEVPAWFKSAQEKARKPKEGDAPVQRSRYSDALDAAVRESSSHFKQANDVIVSEAEQRIQQMRNSIMEVKAPGFGDDDGFEPMPAPARAGAVESPYEGSPHSAAGVDGFLSSVTATSGYQPATVPATVPEPAAASAAPSAPALQVPPISASQGVAASAPQAPSADRTIAFIPVAVDDADLREGAAAQDSSQQALGALYGDEGSDVTVRPAGVSGGVTPRKRRAIALPSLTGSLEKVEEGALQPAPLADGFGAAGAAASPRAQSLSALPTVGAAPRAAQSALRDSLPSLSGVIRAQNDAESAEDDFVDSSNVSQVGSFASGATGTFAPVGDELLNDVAPDEVYIDDADDSVYEDNYTETGAFAGPGYVEMPKSRASRLFGKFRVGRNKKQEETTPQQWLDVNDEFEARAVGKARGGWESFRDEQGNYDYGRGYDDGYDGGYDGQFAGAAGNQAWDDDDWDDGRDGRWNGGGFSRDAFTKLLDRSKKDGGDQGRGARGSRVDAGAGRAERADVGFDELDGLDQDFTASGFEPQGEPAADAYLAVDPYGAADVLLPQADFDEVHAENVQRIYGFRHVGINTEVWFVALGAELAGNGGMKAFMAEHADDLRGSIIIELDALGAGKLTLIEEDGAYRPVKVSSRMKRYVRKASAALGMSVGSGSMCWRDSASAYAMRNGCQAMHLVGMENGKPAFFGEAHDTIEQIDEETMLSNADFVMEVMKGI